MHKCLNCGTEFEGAFCPECGTKFQEEKTCPDCGATLPANSKFCNRCGHSFLPNAPAPASAPPQTPPASQDEKPAFFTVPRKSFIFKLLGLVPAALFALFSLLLFAFYSAPVAVAVLGGESLVGKDLGNLSLGNVYQMLSSTEIPSLRGDMYTLIVFSLCSLALGVLLALTLLLPQYKFKRITLLHKISLTIPKLLTFCAYAFYFIYFVIGCVMIGQINAADEGEGMVAAGACPILLIVFTLLFALFSAGAFAGRFFIQKTNPEFSAKERENIDAWNKEYEEKRAAQKAALTKPVLPEPPEKVEKPNKKSIPAPEGLLKQVYKNVRQKRQLALWCALPFLAIFAAFSVAKSRVKRWTGKNSGTVATAVISMLIAVGAALIAVMFLVDEFIWSADTEVSQEDVILIFCFFVIPFGVLFLYYLGLFIAALAVIRKHKKLCVTFYGVEKPAKDAAPIIDFNELNADYLTYLAQQKSYREYKRAKKRYKAEKEGYDYDCRRYEKGKSYEKRPPRAVVWAWAHKVSASVLSAVLVVIIVLSVALPIALPPVVYDAKFGADKFNELTAEQLLPELWKIKETLGEPFEETESQWVYYTSAYKKKLTEIKSVEEKLLKTESLEEAARLQEQIENLQEALEKINYKSYRFYLRKRQESNNSWTVVYEARFDAKAHDKTQKETQSIAFPQFIRYSSFKPDEVIVKISYTDGSRAVYYLPETALTDVTSKGQYEISWRDIWGTYSATLTIR